MECLKVNLFLLALPLFGESHSQSSRRDWHCIFVHSLDDAPIKSNCPVCIVTKRKVIKGDIAIQVELWECITIWVRDNRGMSIETLQVLNVRYLWHHSWSRLPACLTTIAKRERIGAAELPHSLTTVGIQQLTALTP